MKHHEYGRVIHVIFVERVKHRKIFIKHCTVRFVLEITLVRMVRRITTHEKQNTFFRKGFDSTGTPNEKN